MTHSVFSADFSILDARGSVPRGSWPVGCDPAEVIPKLHLRLPPIGEKGD